MLPLHLETTICSNFLFEYCIEMLFNTNATLTTTKSSIGNSVFQCYFTLQISFMATLMLFYAAANLITIFTNSSIGNTV